MILDISEHKSQSFYNIAKHIKENVINKILRLIIECIVINTILIKQEKHTNSQNEYTDLAINLINVNKFRVAWSNNFRSNTASII